eukprot:TRINITY_DN4136_c0_g1_i2.p1 TRINITY_DN4136_c0_g1~~TRINITY_DN4136_c0_g1_i2.p1  ORF type:complete len:644 (+),score=79.92 TRINITY_DN4136_c0_g1_i2:136-2067(+)
MLTALMPTLVVPSMAGITVASLLISVASFRSQIDHWVLKRFLLPTCRDSLGASVHTPQIERQNHEGRRLWLLCVTLLTMALLGAKDGRLLDAINGIYICACLPLALLTSEPSMTRRYGWAVQATQLAWLAAKLSIMSDAVPSEGMMTWVVLNLLWNEASLCQLSAVLANILFTNLALVLLADPPLLNCAVISLMMLALHVYRRSMAKPSASPTEEPFSSRVAQLVWLVMESGDELCDDSFAMLREAHRLSTHEPPKSLFDVGAGTLTTSNLGTGTGTGCEPCPQEAYPTLSDSPPPAKIQPKEDPGMKILSDMALSPRHPENPPPVNVPQTGGVGAAGADTNWARPPPRLQPLAPKAVNQAAGFPANCAPPQMQEPSASASLPFAQDLVRMAFDSMAQVDLQSGIVLWANASFRELSQTLGGGNILLGIQTLQGCFLQSMPYELNYARATVNLGFSSVDLWSATKVAGAPGQETVLWVVHRASDRLVTRPCEPAPAPPPHQSTSADDSNSDGWTVVTMSGQQPPAASPPEECNYAKASEFMDLQTRIMCDPTRFVTGRGRRQVQMLWRKYGERNLIGNQETTDSGPRKIDRQYYKCTQRDCKARLKVDVEQGTNVQVSSSASGVHNHPTRVVQVAPQVMAPGE